MEQTVYPSDKDIEHGYDEYARPEGDRDDPTQSSAGQAFDDRNSLGNAFAARGELVDRHNQSRCVDLSVFGCPGRAVDRPSALGRGQLKAHNSRGTT